MRCMTPLDARHITWQAQQVLIMCRLWQVQAGVGAAIGGPRFPALQIAYTRLQPNPAPDAAMTETAPRTVTLRLNQQQLELIDRTLPRVGLTDRADLVRLALREAAGQEAAR
tara:strand:+ start:170 stop:505 length:336 start_codon:yes stop_codon:yes gene_type:complete